MNNLERISCRHEGVVLEGQVAVPGGHGPHPAILIVHSAFGLGDQMRSIAARLAEEGYLALAIDMYGEGVYSEDHEVIAGLVRPLWDNAHRLRSRMAAWHEVMKQRPDVAADRIAAIGYCFGGQCVLEYARGGGDLRAVVSFHGILTTNRPAERGAVSAHISVHTGALDPHAPREDVEALRTELCAADADWQITEYGRAYHAFTEPDAALPEKGRVYDPLADRVSWAGTLTLLNTLLKAP